MDTLISIILVGFAVGYLIEFLGDLFQFYLDPALIKKWGSLPLSVGGCFLLEGFTLGTIVMAPAAAFVGLGVIKLLNRPIILQNVAQRRMP
jgi:hypothetical protein